jgi:hypothetical protein
MAATAVIEVPKIVMAFAPENFKQKTALKSISYRRDSEVELRSRLTRAFANFRFVTPASPPYKAV